MRPLATLGSTPALRRATAREMAVPGIFEVFGHVRQRRPTPGVAKRLHKKLVVTNRKRLKMNPAHRILAAIGVPFGWDRDFPRRAGRRQTSHLAPNRSPLTAIQPAWT